MLNSLRQVLINAPDSAQCSDGIKPSVENWLKKKPRKKLKKTSTVRSLPEANLEATEASVEVQVEDSVTTAIGLPDVYYDLAFESDCGADMEF